MESEKIHKKINNQTTCFTYKLLVLQHEDVKIVAASGVNYGQQFSTINNFALKNEEGNSMH